MSRLYLPQVRGELSFEVVIKSQGGEGDEGLEVGVTTTPALSPCASPSAEACP